MKLVVLAGAKKGAAVPIKKNRFVIGRGKDCTLRAGSEAISRNHCELLVTEAGVTVRDLGSRNGTYVNDAKIEGVHALSNGDTLRIGPLEFRYEAEGELKQTKQPKVQSVGDAVARTAAKGGGGQEHLEDDISDWLIGDAATGAAPGVGETLTMRTDETRIARDAAVKAIAEAQTKELSAEDAAALAEGEDGEDDDKKKKKKGEPGKLPFNPHKPQAKDSREAATQILRDMARRR
ncbi:FHA domain-containing protein FhaB [Botrimarina colliarenosi]|uniref:FHA domain-containing protein FhaB n=1 Tax=Botrimarina colliarenosi TaxID=2528001 RepID=A0A5C6AHJ1_9BACT|nr:FHA domain-containing protein [Botrimarina colliarenosi]TWT99099.1 FHA domain-containing protein FhaB [Botrimarina colliarenosi]